MCEVTGGRSYRVKSHYVLNQCIESLVQKVQPGVVVHFEQQMPIKDGEVQDIAFGTTKKMIYVAKHPSQKTFTVGFWPIPEPYWPDPKANNLPPRDAHPKLRIVTPCVEEPTTIRNFPVDKYEVEPSPLTLQILSKREPTKCWPVIVSNGIHGLEMPFGYLKASSNFTQVFLMILPYNYLTLLPLLHDLFHKYGQNPPTDWVYKFTAYVRSIPQYYGPFLRRALVSASVPFQLSQYILPESLDNYLSPAVANYLKTMKNNAKQEQENMCLRVFKQLKLPKPPYHQVEMAKLNCGMPLKRDLVTHPQLKETFAKMHADINIFENYTIVVPTIFQQSSAKNYRNPFEVPRRDLIDEISRMRENFLKLPTTGINIFTKDAGHCLPISEMGNYQEYTKNKQSPLREIEPTNVRQHMFGNPYKKDKHMVMVDEADLGDVAPMKPNSTATQTKKTESTSRPRKRKAGPIRKDYVFQRQSSSDSCSDSSSIGSPMSIASDTDDESMGDASSVASDDDSEHNLIIDFNDEPNIEDDIVNGHVQDFINGEDPDDTVAPVAIQAIAPQLLNFTVPQAPSTPPPPISMLFSTPTTTNTVALLPIPPTTMLMVPSAALVAVTATSTHIPPASVAPIPTTTNIRLQPDPPLVTLNNGINSTNMQNDYDAQEISKILQQCTNGQDQQRLHYSKDYYKPDYSAYGQDDPMDQNVPAPVPPTTDVPIKTEAAAVPPATATVPAASAADNNIHHRHYLRRNSNGHSANTNNKWEIDDGDDEEDDEEQKENVRQNNREARHVIFKDIRRPGRNYSELLEHMNMVQGSLETRYAFVQMCIVESMRFRRKKMADCIQEWWDQQIERLDGSIAR